MSYNILYGYRKHQVGDTADDTYVADMADTQYWSLLTVPTVKSDPLSFLRCFFIANLAVSQLETATRKKNRGHFRTKFLKYVDFLLNNRIHYSEK